MDKTTFSEFAKEVIVIIIICILLGSSTYFGNFMWKSVKSATKSLSDKMSFNTVEKGEDISQPMLDDETGKQEGVAPPMMSPGPGGSSEDATPPTTDTEFESPQEPVAPLEQETPKELFEEVFDLELNDGALVGDTTVRYDKDGNFTLPTPIKDCFTFAGWYDNPEFLGNKITFIHKSWIKKILYAKWEKVIIKENIVQNTPTDVVLVVDQSASMWSTVDGKLLSFADIKNETVNGQRVGYYVLFASNGAYLSRYNSEKGEWQRSQKFGSRSTIDKNTGLVDTPLGETPVWYTLTESFAKDKVIYKSISGALYDSLNIFIEKLETSTKCRVAIATFAGKANAYSGSGVFVDGNHIAHTKLSESYYQNAFDDPTSEEGLKVIHKAINNIYTDCGWTPTEIGLQYARTLFSNVSNPEHNKVAIVFTDGLPNTSNKWENQAKALKEEGATVYAIGPTTGTAGVDVLQTISSGEEFFFNAAAEDMDKIFEEIANLIANIYESGKK